MLRLTVPQALQRASNFHRQGQLADAELIYSDILKVQPQNFDALQLLAVLRYQQSRDAEALTLFEQARALRPESAEMLSNLALVLERLGRHVDALAAVDEALRLKPGHAEALANRGHFLFARGDTALALEYFDRALMARRGFVDAMLGRGVALFKLKRFVDALVTLERVPANDPRYAEALTHRAGPLLELKRHDEALASCERAITIDPRNAVTHYNRGVVLAALGRSAAALESYDRAIALDSGYLDALFNRGHLLEQLGRLDEALASADRVIALRPDHSGAWNNRGNALLKLARHGEAMAAYRKALALDPEYGECCYNYGNALQIVGRVAEALGYFEKALALRPDLADIRFNEAVARLLLGDLKRGLQSYEGRFDKTEQAPARRKFNRPLWTGGDPAGRTILLHAEQGHGDTIQFVRYVPLLARAGATVLLEVQHALKPLLAGVEGVAHIFDRDQAGRSETLPAFDSHQYLISLPHVMGTELHSIPAEIPYIRAPQDRLELWRKRLPPADGLRVGLTWSGNPQVTSDVRRSVGLPLLAPLVSVPGVQFVSLHREVRPDHVATLRTLPQILHFGEQLRDFADTAALIAELDLVISSDTAVAHLAGAMGKPLWLLTMVSPDWRWLLDRDDSPWYPTAKLYRQEGIGDWVGVVERVREDLVRLTQAK
jgi:tetratricopeptide (TPR) repeat protein